MMLNFDSVMMVVKALVVLAILMQIAPLMAWVERRGSALMQNRLGPNRIGPLGLFQSICDAIKFLFKEDPIPGQVIPFWYLLAPVVSLVPSFMTFAVIPWAAPLVIGDHTVTFQVADLNVGLLYIFAIASLGVYGIIMAGWASNNKYALLGSLRSSSQMISYELSMGLSVIGLIMAFSSSDRSRSRSSVLLFSRSASWFFSPRLSRRRIASRSTCPKASPKSSRVITSSTARCVSRFS
jgi:NADH-quinone oxidoreductase subunit H